MERAIDRAVDGVKELMRSELRTIAAELRALNDRQEKVENLEERVEGIDSRLTATEAVLSAHRERLGEAEGVIGEVPDIGKRLARVEGGKADLRAWLWNHAPSLALGLGALMIALFR